MTLMIALLLQAAPAPVDCGAIALGDPERASFEAIERAMTFAMLAAQGDEAGFAVRFSKTSAAIHDRAVMPGNGATLEGCRAAYPAAWQTGPVTLPADRFERGLTCMSAAGSRLGAAREYLRNYGEDIGVARIEATANRMANVLSDAEFAAHGIETEAQVKLAVAGTMMRWSKLGVVSRVAAACDTAYPG